MEYLCLTFSPNKTFEGHFFETYTYIFKCEGGQIQRPVSIALEDPEYEEKRKILLDIDKILKIVNLEYIPSYIEIINQLIKPLLKPEREEVLQ